MTRWDLDVLLLRANRMDVLSGALTTGESDYAL